MYKQVIHHIQTVSDPIRATKCLWDLAVAQGCQTDISVIVVKQNINSNVNPQAAVDKPAKTVVESQNLENEEEDAAVTNIDNVITNSRMIEAL